MARIAHHKVRALGAIAERMARSVGEKGDNAAARRFLAEVNRVHAGAAALDNVRANRSPLDTAEGHALKVGKLAKKFDNEVTAVINRSGEIWREGMSDVQRRIDEKIDLKPNAFAEEIRATFRTMNRKSKVELLGQLVKENRGPELAAIVKAPSILSGISDAERADYERAIISMHAPKELAEQTWLDELFDSVGIVATTSSGLVRDFMDPGELARIERAEASAVEAGEAFDQSLQ
ncbi:hypothetical protein U8326_02240 [Tsuneonella sp. CC-YZS046]|uniref:hypothetical protein n=1 Tax=Tsuneonella sp. CC-YZS046 TaxID=3042152 RepID=UPI002D7733CA|nr:hypothetical protein [Tsuneonella sp. CC-YZS046]WRO67013.1 hypothetical protein U8326_02240 [Tsuneonella sp. CC-YZS046]